MNKRKRTTNGKTIYIHPENERQILKAKPKIQSFSEFIVRMALEAIDGEYAYSNEHRKGRDTL